jgi:hypothetical protein
MSAGALQGLAYSMPTGGYSAAMRGGDAWHPSEADIAGAEAAPGQCAMFIDGEYAFAKLFQGLVRLYRAAVAAKGSTQGGLNLFKFGSSQATKGSWKVGDRFLRLPNRGTPKLN